MTAISLLLRTRRVLLLLLAAFLAFPRPAPAAAGGGRASAALKTRAWSSFASRNAPLLARFGIEGSQRAARFASLAARTSLEPTVLESRDPEAQAAALRDAVHAYAADLESRAAAAAVAPEGELRALKEELAEHELLAAFSPAASGLPARLAEVEGELSRRRAARVEPIEEARRAWDDKGRENPGVQAPASGRRARPGLARPVFPLARRILDLARAEREAARLDKAGYRLSADQAILGPPSSSAGAPEVFEDAGIKNTVLEALAQGGALSGHSLDADKYIERHFSRELLRLLLDEPRLGITLLQGDLGEAVAWLKALGYDRVEILPSDRRTDFDRVLAFNSKTGKAHFLLSLLEGESYLHEAAANLLFYREEGSGRRIDPARVRAWRLRASLERRFAGVLREQGVDPDIVFFAYASNLEKTLASIGVLPEKKFMTRELSGRVYTLEGRKVLSVNIEPELYGDRAGVLIDAARSLGRRRRGFAVLGTAGSARRDIRIGEYAIPASFSHANLPGGPAPRLEGNGAAAADFSDIPGARVHAGEGLRHVAVDSILYETGAWLRSRSRESDPGGADIVEQEGYGLARAARRGGDWFGAVYRVSDELWTGNDFTGHEGRLQADATLSLMQLRLLNLAARSLDESRRASGRP